MARNSIGLECLVFEVRKDRVEHGSETGQYVSPRMSQNGTSDYRLLVDTLSMIPQYPFRPTSPRGFVQCQYLAKRPAAGFCKVQQLQVRQLSCSLR